MAALGQPEASMKAAWIIAIAATVRRVWVIVCIGVVPVVRGGLCRLAHESADRPTAT